MHCPKCKNEDTKVADTRLGKDSRCIKRRRECLRCEHRFSTIESVLREPMEVIKRDGRRQPFEPQKIYQGLISATEKTSITPEALETLVDSIVQKLEDQFSDQIPTKAIGEAILKELKHLDPIAYLRFVSVHKQFQNLSQISRAISALKVS